MIDWIREREREEQEHTHLHENIYSLSRTQPTQRTALTIYEHTKLKLQEKRNDLISSVQCVITFSEIKELAGRELTNWYLPDTGHVWRKLGK